jgi:CubicO group peptidase (beta-lactamase class C family)
MRWSFAFHAASLLVPISLLLSVVGCGGTSNSANPDGSLGSTVDALAQTAVQQQGIPGITVALAKNGSVLYLKGYGVSDLATQQPAEPPDIFEIGSITKQFTAAIIMQLQEQGKLRVDDSLSLYLPQYTFPASITLRMLLSHTSGLANYTDFPQLGDWVKHGVSEATVLTAVGQAPLQFQPGTQYSYSNSNFFALGTIIENVTGLSYQTNLEQRIFGPLKMSSTYYELPPAGQAAIGYRNNGAGLVPAVLWDRSAAFAAGALSTDLKDLITWDNALLRGKVVSAASFQAMTTSNGFPMPGGGSYGFGLALYTFNNRPIIWHNGQIGGFTAETAVFLDSGFSIVVLTNDQDANPDALVLKIMNSVCGSSQLSGNC